MGNLWFFSGILSLVMSKDPVSDALQRTTTAPTIFQAGFKENGRYPSFITAHNFENLWISYSPSFSDPSFSKGVRQSPHPPN